MTLNCPERDLGRGRLGAPDLLKMHRVTGAGNGKQLIEGSADQRIPFWGFLGEGTSWGLAFRKGTRKDPGA